MKYEDISGVGADAIALPKTENVGWYERFGKRVLDIALALVLFPLLAPVVAVLWMIARAEGGSGFYGHQRIGQHGSKFKCWKIRSMVQDANERLRDLLESDPDARAEWDYDQKLTNDPRITRFGSFMRRTSLDELPQIINVLRGEMSFVGPRPVIEEELARYGANRAAYLQCKPGITGIWQLSGRNEASYAQRVEFDAEYSENISLALDISLIARTPASVLIPTGK
ncbi:sugar transferase [Tateyamaria sp. Alg231-49]|uniref:sugar transferase n=1 Tax=Tateyamaria sp. Alg231-49 TaxID=1922219 RepID=UPI000D55C638|nr:sugar transferase [Tateyamaria sp. Alg231-49]